MNQMRVMTVAEIWASFERGIMPSNAPDVQRIETKRAFYAGFLKSFALVKEIGQALEEDAAVAELERIERELMQFYGQMIQEAKTHG